jgi:MFS family permease
MLSMRNRVITLCIIVNMLDGFDILAMAYTAPALAKVWAIPPEQLGLVFSIGLAGMMIGSIAIGLLADSTGRRPMILACLALGTLGMLGAAHSADIRHLSIARFITGLAIGGMLPCINSMVAEYALPRWRSMAVSLMQAGFAIGASAGGFLSLLLLKQWGWSGVFTIGAIMTGLLLPIVFLGMPESLGFLASKPGRESQYRTLLGKLGLAEAHLPPEGGEGGKGIRALADHAAPLVLIFAIWFLCVMSFYFLNSWVPKILADGGLSEGQAVMGGAMLTAGGVISALVLGWISLQQPLVRIVATATAGSAIMTLLFGQISGEAIPLMGAAFLLGLLTNATQIGIYAVLPGLFPSSLRAGATGLAIGMGRLGSVLGPWLAGVLLAAGWNAPSLFAAMALPYLCAAILMLPLQRWLRY